MLELSIIKALLNKDFHDKVRGGRCPDRIFSKEGRKIKQVLDRAMSDAKDSLNVTDLEALFMSYNLSMTTANKKTYEDLFKKMRHVETPSEAVSYTHLRAHET